MPIGPTILAQAAESLRKIRNSARFILGNIGDQESRRGLERTGRREMGLVSYVLQQLSLDGYVGLCQAERYVMHELHKLEKVAHEGYGSYNFPKGDLFNDVLSSVF
jgi:isoleucyl-tRNA synthetase